MQFQSTLPRRERPSFGFLPSISFRFQSTLPRRERLYDRYCKEYDWNFNPRSREGSDPILLERSILNANFNPRSREGSDGIY